MSEDIRMQLISKTADILKTGIAPDKITSRMIAQKAECALGLINYHFKDKADLIRLAANLIIEAEAEPLLSSNSKISNIGEFIQMMCHVADVMVAMGPLGVFIARHTLLKDNLDLTSRIVDAVGPEKPGLFSLRVTHFLWGMQALFVRQKDVEESLNIDISDKTVRDAFIADLAHRLLE